MKSILNIIGCDNPSKSVSYEISKFVEERVISKAIRFTNITVEELLSSEVKLTSLINDLYDYDNVILYTPLYIDGFSSRVVKLLEILSQNKKYSGRVPYFSVIINSNSQEGEMGKYTISSAKIFSDYMGFKWQRGIHIGLAKSVEGKHIKKLGITYEPIIKELLMFCADIVNEKQTFGINFAAPSLPKRFWVNANNMYWRHECIKNKSFNKLNAKPYKYKAK